MARTYTTLVSVFVQTFPMDNGRVTVEAKNVRQVGVGMLANKPTLLNSFNFMPYTYSHTPNITFQWTS